MNGDELLDARLVVPGEGREPFQGDADQLRLRCPRAGYLIGFLDDYSRFVVGEDLFRSPTAAAVIEVYRVAIGEYQPPKEMLTDNGRQYTAWRGVSRFEAELKKDHVSHIKSRPATR